MTNPADRKSLSLRSGHGKVLLHPGAVTAK